MKKDIKLNFIFGKIQKQIKISRLIFVFSKKEDKEISQLWAVTNNNQCLGRVFDNRDNRFIVNGCKFPIGFFAISSNRLICERKGLLKTNKNISVINIASIV